MLCYFPIDRDMSSIYICSVIESQNAMEFQDTKQVGSWGERTAQSFLEENGYTVLETNWRCSHKEVDIIAQKDSTVIFVEVKTRTTTFINPADAVNKQKQKLLLSAANYYVRRNKLDCDVRFDIISIIARNGSYTIEHIENAFYPKVQ